MKKLAARPYGYFRGLLIGYGVAFFSWYFSRSLPTPAEGAWTRGSVTMIAIGLALQLFMLLVKWWVGRYERTYGMQGMLKPAAVELVQLLIDGVTVLLFAVATFRSIHIAAQM